MKRRKDHDQPRPRDDSQACAARLRQGDHHALPDLIDALRREQDIRFFTLAQAMEEALSCMRWHPNNTQQTIALWQQLCLMAVRLMTPEKERLAHDIAAFAARHKPGTPRR